MVKIVEVDRRKLIWARRLLAPYLKEERRSLPKEDLTACSYCEYATGKVCCKCREVYG